MHGLTVSTVRPLWCFGLESRIEGVDVRWLGARVWVAALGLEVLGVWIGMGVLDLWCAVVGAREGR